MANVTLYGTTAEVPEHLLLHVDEHGDPWIKLDNDCVLFCKNDAQRIELFACVAYLAWEQDTLLRSDIHQSHVNKQKENWREIRDAALGQQHR